MMSEVINEMDLDGNEHKDYISKYKQRVNPIPLNGMVLIFLICILTFVVIEFSTLEEIASKGVLRKNCLPRKGKKLMNCLQINDDMNLHRGGLQIHAKENFTKANMLNNTFRKPPLLVDS